MRNSGLEDSTTHGQAERRTDGRTKAITISLNALLKKAWGLIISTSEGHDLRILFKGCSRNAKTIDTLQR